MKVAIVGGTGLIGSAVLARLSSLGHSVVSMSRSAIGVSANHVAVDISKATSPAYWLPYLEGVEAVVNCAGVLQDAFAARLRQPLDDHVNVCSLEAYLDFI